jgi:trans-2,3-dihydro-3-hydroxyanthranilate isomerase
LVDVFTDRPFGGNPLAVFSHARGIPDDLMQDIARELNTSETTFVLPPKDPRNDFCVRIFTPTIELPIAGHPTIGTAFVLAREGLIDASDDECTVRFEEGVGPLPVSVRFEDGEPVMATMGQPLPAFGPRFEDRPAIARMLSIDPSDIDAEYPLEVISSGVPFLFVPIRDLHAIAKIKLRLDLWERTLQDFAGPSIFAFTRETELEGSTVHGRMFAPAHGILEDAATGNASGPLGSYLVKYGLVLGEESASIISEQGFEIGRPSLIHINIEQHEGEIAAVHVGGQCVFIGEGTIEL